MAKAACQQRTGEQGDRLPGLGSWMGSLLLATIPPPDRAWLLNKGAVWNRVAGCSCHTQRQDADSYSDSEQIRSDRTTQVR